MGLLVGGASAGPKLVAAQRSVDWTRFGFDAGRSDSGPAATGITAANVRSLVRQQVRIDGTADSSPIFAASPDWRIHKLAVATGREAAGWPVTITRVPTHEKIGPALNFARGLVFAATGG